MPSEQGEWAGGMKESELRGSQAQSKSKFAYKTGRLKSSMADGQSCRSYETRRWRAQRRWMLGLIQAEEALTSQGREVTGCKSLRIPVAFHTLLWLWL